MHIVDIIFIGAIIAALFRGYRRGFVLQFISLVSVILAFILAYLFSPQVAVLIRPFFKMQEIHEILALPIPINISVNQMAASAVAYALVFIGSRIGLMVLGRSLDLVCKIPVINGLNSILGLLLSFAETLVILVVIVNIGSMLPVESIQNIVEQSSVSQYILEEFGFLRERLMEVIMEKVLS